MAAHPNANAPHTTTKTQANNSPSSIILVAMPSTVFVTPKCNETHHLYQVNKTNTSRVFAKGRYSKGIRLNKKNQNKKTHSPNQGSMIESRAVLMSHCKLRSTSVF
jgi:hypothetical protein